MKKNIHKLEMDFKEYKKIKHEKQSILIVLNNEENKSINIKDNILITNNKKKFKRRVKKIETYSNLDEIKKNVSNKQLGYKKKDIINYDDLVKNYTKNDIKKYGLLAIELKKKKHILKKIFFTILFLVLIIFLGLDIYKKIEKMNIQKYQDALIEISNDKLSYVFLEINPSFALILKGSNVSDAYCLNDDCLDIYNDINIKDKNINESIDIIYNISKEKGFDTSKGVKVKSSESINIEKKDYIALEYIEPNKEKELLDTVKNKDNLTSINNDVYYHKLWEKLKKDSDYDKVYSCNMDNGKLECYFIIESIMPMADVLDESKPVTDIMSQNVFSVLNKVKRTLNKFNIKTIDSGFGTVVYINNIGYTYALDTNLFRDYTTQICYDDFGCFPQHHRDKFNIKDLDLLNPSSIQSKIEIY